MIIKLHDGTEIEIGDHQFPDGTVHISPDDMPGVEGPGCAVYVTKDEAERIITALRAAFGISGSFEQGFRAALVYIEDKEDRYGIGSMLSQWTGEEIARDIATRAGIL